MKYSIPGKNDVNLTDLNYHAEGGEGKIYVIGDTAYKIYTGATPPVGKITQLQGLSHPAIINPKDLIFDARKAKGQQNVVGYSMAYVPNTLALCRLFVTDFLNRNNITQKQLVELVKQMRNTFDYVHGKNMLVVDANENNFLVKEGEWVTPYFIDVLNWQTPTFPPNAILPNIQDQHTKGFNSNTDWFSFAVLTCQLFTGIHPYKGSHPDYKKNDFLTRMKDNVSIFNNKVKLPSVVRDFSIIPPNLLDWYREVLEDGVRSAPPIAFDGPKPVVLKPTTQIINSQNLSIQLVQTFDNELLDIHQANARTAYYLNGGVSFNRIKYPSKTIMFGVNENWWVSGDNSKIILENVDGKTAPQELLLNYHTLTMVDNTLYAISNQKLMQIGVFEGNISRLVVQKTWTLLPGQTQSYENMLVINALGQRILVTLDSSRANTTLVKEINTGKIINAKYMNNVAFVITEEKGIMTKHIIRWSPDFSQYNIWKFENISTADINFTVLENGITVSIEDDGHMIVFNNNHTVKQMKDVRDAQILSKMRLIKYNSRIHFIVDNQLYSMSMK